MKDQLANLLNIGSLSEKDKTALVRLLSDPDPDIFRAISQVLLNCGIEIRSCLRAGLDSDDRLVRQRSWKLITLLDRKTANADFISFCKRGGENLNPPTKTKGHHPVKKGQRFRQSLLTNDKSCSAHRD